MVVRIMGWRPWPPNSTKKFKVTLRLHSLEIIRHADSEQENEVDQITGTSESFDGVMMIKMEWRGLQTGFGQRLLRNEKRCRSSKKKFQHGRNVHFQEDFNNVCFLTPAKETGFLPYYLQFIVFQTEAKSKPTIFGKTYVNLGELAPSTQEMMKHTIRLRLTPPDSITRIEQYSASLVVTIKFLEVRLSENASMDRFMTSSLHCLSGPLICDHQIRDMYGKKIKDIKRSVSLNWKKTSGEIDGIIICNGKLSMTSEESSSDNGDVYDTDSFNDSEEDKLSDGEEKMVLQSYGPLVGVNLFIEGALPELKDNRHVAGTVTCIPNKTRNCEASANELSMSDSDQGNVMLNIFSWKKRKLNFRSSRPVRGEPLLNKSYGDDGGDDIDRDRRMSGCPIDPCCSPNQEKAALCSAISECLDFGEERFSIGSWEKKDLVSRDGNMKLSTNVFFASIDQRSERAAGESACTVLVAVIADWLHKNPNCMPIKAEFDTLIREGSTEWRKLCDDETYRTNFFDGHFDLDTVMNARIRPLAVDHARSFVGFFQPEGLDETYKDVLQGHKYFDDIWSAIEQNAILQPDESFQPAIYIVSWNDHFFILKVCKEAYYIMDTLGERLYEGCKQAYAIRFDSETSLYYLPHSKVEDAKNSQSSPGSAIINRQIAPDSSASKTESFPDGCSSKGQESSVAALIDIEINEARDNIAASLTNKEEGIEKVQGSEQENHKTEYKAKNIAASSTKNEEGVEKLQGSEYENHKTEYKAKDACREFLKGFFAALPIRELQTDLKKGLVGENALHQRLQIEFNFTYLEHYKQ